MQHILRGLDYLHKNGIVHRDLKVGNSMTGLQLTLVQPENILIEITDGKITALKIMDFGLSKIVTASRLLSTACGTPLYIGNFLPTLAITTLPARCVHAEVPVRVHSALNLTTAAPEVLECQPYDSKEDVWAAGVICYMLYEPKATFAALS